MSVEIICGDVIDVLASYADGTFVATFSDPPYGLSKQPDMVEVLTHWLAGDAYTGLARKGTKHCAANILDRAIIADANNVDSLASENLVPFHITLRFPNMGIVGVQLNDKVPVGKEKIDDKGATRPLKNVLMNETYTRIAKSLSDGDFMLTKRQAFPGCVTMCSCYTKSGSS